MGVVKEKREFLSSDGHTQINTVIWHPDNKKFKEPLAVLQLVHGMVDYIERYEELAVYMAERGFLVAGNDHLGHGESVSTEQDYGFFDDKRPEDVLVLDMHRLTRILKKRYSGIPVFMAGHSMGSFMTRKYIMIYGYELDGVILLGTGNQPDILVNTGYMLTKLVGAIKGERYRSVLLKNIMFGSYNKRINNPKTDNDWITRDEDVVEAYCNDPKCTFSFTVNAYKGMLGTIRYIKNEKNIAHIPYDLPMLIAVGLDDPVGGYGKDILALYEQYHKHIDNIELNMYEKCRHELHNELNRDEIFADLYEWLMDKISN